MQTTGDTRQRIVMAATELFRRQGYNATGMKQILASAGATYGSAYHFFPGGKAQLGEEAVRASGTAYLALITELFVSATAAEPRDMATVTRDAFTAAARTLQELDFADPCPIATVAMEMANTNETLRRATAEAFLSWTERLAEYYAAGGMTEPLARETASSVLALLEGAFMLGRATRSIDPVLAASRAAAGIVRAAFDDPVVSPQHRDREAGRDPGPRPALP
ncbi:TetR/AcrR family transcriptional regulator [Streptomyces sp. NPDC020096]